MVTTLIPVITSDISGENGAHTVQLSLDGIDREVDLTGKEHDDLREKLQPFISAARKVGKSGRKARVTIKPSSAQTIRMWARTNGVKVPERGRIPESVREAFEAAQR